VTSLAGVELRHLAALVAVAEERSFGRAAVRLGFTQSAVSQQIAAFERSIGVSLFDRPGGPAAVTLTPAGELLLEHARRVLGAVDVAQRELERLLAGEAGTLTVGTFQSVSVRALPPIIARLRHDRPGVEVRLFETDETDELVRRTVDGELDLAFVVEPVGSSAVELQHLCLDPFVLLARRDAGLPRAVAPAQLRELTLIGQKASSCQLLVDQGLRGQGVDPDYVFRSNDNGAVQAMVRAGMGVAVLPWLAIDPDDPEIRVHPLDPPIPPRSIGLIRRADRTLSPGAEAFAALAAEVFAHLHDAAPLTRIA
jgi:DNA-binding transcriptional LysR family regulator